jgi:DNA-binding NarL/FixJ family response regulator
MTDKRQLVLVTNDEGLAAHWRSAFGRKQYRVASGLTELSRRRREDPATLWVDAATLKPGSWRSAEWQEILLLDHIKVIAASSNPNDEDAMEALDAGCAGYCHAYASAATLKQVTQVVDEGQVWIGKSLMRRLLHGTSQIAKAVATSQSDWHAGLTQREREIANLAANGASNQLIADNCGISERTVKAHLSAVFTKLNVSDRLQLALRVHGIS